MYAGYVIYRIHAFKISGCDYIRSYSDRGLETGEVIYYFETNDDKVVLQSLYDDNYGKVMGSPCKLERVFPYTIQKAVMIQNVAEEELKNKRKYPDYTKKYMVICFNKYSL